MKILHLCLSAFYIEGMSYQENLLPQYHKKMGYEVDIVASLQSFSKDGEYIFNKHASEYINKYGIHVKTLNYKRPIKLSRILKRYIGTYEALEESNPDIVFCHGIQFMDASVLVKYMKNHPNVKLFADNHSDFSNSASNWISKNIQHKVLWRHYAQKLNPYVTKFWGVLPARVDFLVEMYDLPREKVDLLVMGADDELADNANAPSVRFDIRTKYGFNQNDFIIVSGGKIDHWKKQTLLLMDAVNHIEVSRVKLMVFGSVIPELKAEVEKRCSDKVKYIGWVKSQESYDLFASCDLACFPGRHSVYWEQVAGQGIPMVCKFWEGTTHIDLGGNVVFLYQDSEEEISRILTHIIIDGYTDMKRNAEINKSKFRYSLIAKMSIDDSLIVN